MKKGIAQAVMARLEALGRISDEPGRLTRTFCSPAMQRANQLVHSWMRQAGMTTRQDAIGNLIGHYAAEQRGQARGEVLLLGSHLDTVRNAGKFDGPLGVLTAIACVQRLHENQIRLPFAIEVIATAVGLAVLLYALYRGPLALKLFISFAAVLFTACLARPLASDPGEQWEIMMGPTNFTRYYFFPMLAFVAALVWLVQPFQARALRWPALAILLLLPIGIFRDWRYPRYVDYDFSTFVEVFNQSAPGTKCTILINPPGWEMHLIKH